MIENAGQIIVTLLTVLTSAGAWQFYQTRMKARDQKDKEEKTEHTLFRDDLRERVAQLEQKLEDSYREKEEVNRKLTDVLQELASCKVRLQFLEAENERLKNR